MANLVTSIGYSLGKLHTGLLAYLCNLHQEGCVAPLGALFGALGVNFPRQPIAVREWNSIDLAILEQDSHAARILIEMKVDDHDHETARLVDGQKRKGFQTDIYAQAFRDCEAYLYVTLGVGEYYHAPYGARFRWIRIQDFLRALDEIDTTDRAILDWREAVRNEADLQDRVSRNDPSRIEHYRPGGWNIYLLGQVKEAFEARLGPHRKYIDATCYTYGTRPDTILNFGWGKSPAYMEINNNGRLNVKVGFDDTVSADERQRIIADQVRRVEAMYPRAGWVLRAGGRLGASMTIASFDIGLAVTENRLRFVKERKYTVDQLLQIVSIFYAPLATDA